MRKKPVVLPFTLEKFNANVFKNSTNPKIAIYFDGNQKVWESGYFDAWIERKGIIKSRWQRGDCVYVDDGVLCYTYLDMALEDHYAVINFDDILDFIMVDKNKTNSNRFIENVPYKWVPSPKKKVYETINDIRYLVFSKSYDVDEWVFKQKEIKTELYNEFIKKAFGENYGKVVMKSTLTKTIHEGDDLLQDGYFNKHISFESPNQRMFLVKIDDVKETISGSWWQSGFVDYKCEITYSVKQEVELVDEGE